LAVAGLRLGQKQPRRQNMKPAGMILTTEPQSSESAGNAAAGSRSLASAQPVVRSAIGRPRIPAQKEAAIRRDLLAGRSLRSTIRAHGVGSKTAQRIKAELPSGKEDVGA
jgi:hypothetical protein